MDFNGIRPSFNPNRTNIVATRGPSLSAEERLAEVRALCHTHFTDIRDANFHYVRGLMQGQKLERVDLVQRVTQSLRNFDKRLRQGGLRTSLYQCRPWGDNFATTVHRDVAGDSRFIAELQAFDAALQKHPMLLRDVPPHVLRDTVHEHIGNLQNDTFESEPHSIYNWYQPRNTGELTRRPLHPLLVLPDGAGGFTLR